LIFLLEIALWGFASWTAAYHVALLLALPARWAIVPFLVILAVLAALSRDEPKRWLRQARQEGSFALGALATGLAAGAFTLFVSRPDKDDFGFFYRALEQLERLDLPFLSVDTVLHVSGPAPPLPTVHIITSYEPLAALTATLFGADPLSMYQNICGFFAALLLPIVYFLLYRHFRASRLVALLGTLVAIGFLLLDGGTHQSFGNFGLVRIWQGKVILVTVLLPATLLLAHRYLIYPTSRKLGILAIAGVCAVGLSSSGVFLFPLLVFAVSLAYLLEGGLTRRRLQRAVTVNLGSLYCVAIAAGLMLGLIREAADLTVWNTSAFPTSWWDNLALVFVDKLTLARSLMILFALPLLGLGKIMGRFVALLSVALLALCANPLLGPVWLDILGPVVYWRLAYLFPLPLCAGLLVGVIGRQISARRVLSPGSLAIAVTVILFAVSFKATVVDPSDPLRPVFLKPALEYRLPPAEMGFVRSVAGHLDDKVILAPFDMVAVLGLMNSTVSFEATRPTYLRYELAGRGDAEIARRLDAQNYVTRCRARARDAEALLRSIDTGVNVIVARACHPGGHPVLGELEEKMPGSWTVIETAYGYTLLVSTESANGDNLREH
jgi:hypothetical protein